MSARDRNKPCSCGSGKKSKRCCDSPEAHAARVAQKAAEAEARRAEAARPEVAAERRRKARAALAIASTIGGGIRW